MYNTTANCHSVADVAAAVGLSVLSYLLVISATKVCGAMATKGYGAIKSCWNARNFDIGKGDISN